jgi:endonuclease YncB( thermonuclease family)
VLALLLAAGLAALSALRPREPRAAPAVSTPLGQLAVLDGDTLRLPDGRRLRLPVVDTPEMGRPCSDEARAFTAARLQAAREVRLADDDPPRDRYGRLLADVLLDGASLSASLLGAGLATVYDSESAELLALQAAAVAERRGMHARLPLARGPYLLTARRLHRPGCPWVRTEGRFADLRSDAAAALQDGRSPCRTCLAWPP